MKNLLRIILLATLVLMASHVVNSFPHKSIKEKQTLSSVYSNDYSVVKSKSLSANDVKSKSSIDYNINE